MLHVRRMVLAPNAPYEAELQNFLADHHNMMPGWVVQGQQAPNIAGNIA